MLFQGFINLATASKSKLITLGNARKNKKIKRSINESVISFSFPLSIDVIFNEFT